MNSEVIPCPACKHVVRVPESLFGQPVRCPECKSYFTAPIRDAEGKLGEPVLLPQPVAPVLPSQRKSMSDSPIFVPALCLVMVSTVGFLVNGFQVYMWFNNPERAELAVGWLLEQIAKMLQREFNPEHVQVAFEVGRILHIIVLSMSTISLLGGLAMVFHRFRWLAILGSVLAMLNAGNCCCLIGIPAGGYCLIKLLDPDIAPLFRRT